MIDTFCAVELAFIAAFIAIGISRKKDMWWWIVVYWFVLTEKNILAVIG